MSFNIVDHFKDADLLIKSANRRDLDEEIASYHRKFACLLVCGAIEQSIKFLIVSHFQQQNAERVVNFLKNYFKTGANFKCEEISKTLSKFDENWNDQFKMFLSQNSKIKESINSCYNLRNSLAHGRSANVESSSLTQYFNDSVALVSQLEKIVK
jgi:hypothetical protein